MPTPSRQIREEQAASSDAGTEALPPPPVITSIDRNENADPAHGTAYARLDGDQSKAILERNGETFVMHSFDNDPNFAFSRYNYRDFRFSPSGRYVSFTGIGWEWGEQYLYDVDAKKIVAKTDMTDNWGITPNEDRYFTCSAAGMASTAEALLLSLPDGAVLAKIDQSSMSIGTGSFLDTVSCTLQNGTLSVEANETGGYTGEEVPHSFAIDLETGKVTKK